MADATVRGYAVRWNELSVDLGGFRERFQRGAFTESLATDDTVFMLRSHDMSRPVASTSSGTLTLREDRIGLAFDATLPDGGDAGDLAATVKRRVLTRMSFAFATERASDETFQEIDGALIRTIKRAKLFEVSPVTFPAYPTTSIRSVADQGDAPAPLKRSTTKRRKAIMTRRQTAAEAALSRSKPTPRPQSDTARRLRQDRMQRTLQSHTR